MDLDDFRTILESSGVDVWTLIDTALVVASLDYGGELKQRRDKIVERLYAMSLTKNCRNCDFGDGVDDARRNGNGREMKEFVEKEPKERATGSPSTPPHKDDEDDDDDDEDNDGNDCDDGLDRYAGLFDDNQKKILEIKQQLEDPNLSEDSLVDLLLHLADMDITFHELKDTDIGRHVNRLRKHPSNDVRRLVKQLVRKWKEIVDEWVRLNPQGENASSGLMADGDSPLQKIPQNGHHQVPDFAYSPNPHNGSSGSDKNHSEPERKIKPVPRKDTPSRPSQQSVNASTPAYSIQRQREQQKESNFDSQRLASARKRLQQNYKEAENAKRQRTIQVMDIHELPKPKNSFFPRNKGSGGGSGGGSQGRHCHRSHQRVHCSSLKKVQFRDPKTL
ncbi:hypothetical protein K2173_014603 [Erythroxylum novogranatense]|uniref:TFIIS N-terminal domain-containing protein n=1 Tax=Erythroxylum novogranatense TaxID=1862640 RepID=A0AAV8TGE9_9ROSI|nr:hypothetical protein K2173_014603 [Erythroxylum novogranatense]